MLTNLICPISSERIDSNTSRLTVFINAVLLVNFLISLQPISLFIVTIDCAIRAFGNSQYSPITAISKVIIKLTGTKTKLVAKAPKIFASRLGFLCALFGSVFIILNLSFAALIVIGLFAVLAILDSVFDICVGCIIYNYIVFPFYQRRD